MTNATVLRIYPEANMTSLTKPSNGNCKSLIAVDLYEFYGSYMSFIEKYHVSYSMVAYALKTGKAISVYRLDENGNKIRIGKTRLTRGAHSVTAMDTVMKSGRSEKEKNEKLQAENDQLKKELEEFRAFKAEQEKKRKAEEDHAIALEKANKKVERKQRIFDRLLNETIAAEALLNEAIMERDALLKGDENIA